MPKPTPVRVRANEVSEDVRQALNVLIADAVRNGSEQVLYHLADVVHENTVLGDFEVTVRWIMDVGFIDEKNDGSIE